jgi:hypothetical protein
MCIVCVTCVFVCCIVVVILPPGKTLFAVCSMSESESHLLLSESRLSTPCEILNISQPYRPPRPVREIVLFYLPFIGCGGRSVGIVRSRTKGHGVCLFFLFFYWMYLSNIHESSPTCMLT